MRRASRVIEETIQGSKYEQMRKNGISFQESLESTWAGLPWNIVVSICGFCGFKNPSVQKKTIVLLVDAQSCYRGSLSDL